MIRGKVYMFNWWVPQWLIDILAFAWYGENLERWNQDKWDNHSKPAAYFKLSPKQQCAIDIQHLFIANSLICPTAVDIQACITRHFER